VAVDSNPRQPCSASALTAQSGVSARVSEAGSRPSRPRDCRDTEHDRSGGFRRPGRRGLPGPSRRYRESRSCWWLHASRLVLRVYGAVLADVRGTTRGSPRNGCGPASLSSPVSPMNTTTWPALEAPPFFRWRSRKQILGRIKLVPCSFEDQRRFPPNLVVTAGEDRPVRNGEEGLAPMAEDGVAGWYETSARGARTCRMYADGP